MGNMFGNEKTMKQETEIIREQKRMVDRSVRDLTREKQGMERTEQQLINDIRKAAKAGQVKSAKIMAKDLVRTRKHKEKFTNLMAQLRVMSLQMSEVSSQHALAESMKNVTRAMTALNRQVNLPQLQATMAEFQKQAEVMEMKQEMMEDAMGDVLDDEEDEEEEEKILGAVMDEIGIKLNEDMVAAPSTSLKSKQKEAEVAAQPAVADPEDNALEARLANLKR